VAQAEQPPTTVGEEKEEQRRFQAERAILERQGGVLVPAGQLVVEPSFQYAYDSARSLNLEGASFENVIFIGRFNVQRVTRDVFEPSLLMRYGLQRRVQLELTVPYLFRTDEFDNNIASTQQGVERTDSLHNNGFGDIQLGLFTQLLYQRSWWPDVVLNLQASFPTGDNPFELSANQVPLGSGTYGFSGGFSVVRTLDPVVLFGGIRYTYDLEHDFGSPFGKIQYGGNIEYNAGMALALNERLALTMTLQSNIQGKTRCDSSDPSLNGLCMGGKKLQGTNFNSAQVFLGGSYRVTRLTTVNAAVGIGLTDDSPDYTINFSVPIRFPETFWHL
jgi:hypothetical protein